MNHYSAPGIHFNYHFSAEGDQPLGLIQNVINPMGGYTKFEYEQIAIGDPDTTLIDGGSRSVTITNPWGETVRGAVRTWSGQDYVVCCWINDDATAVKLNVYTWWGRWEPALENSPILFETPVDINRIQVIPSQNTFLFILPPVSADADTPVYLFNRQKLQQASWELSPNTTVTPFHSNQLTGIAGADFFLLKDDQGSRLDRYTWNALMQDWEQDTQSLDETLKHYLCAGDRCYAILSYDVLQERGSFTYIGLDRFNQWTISNTVTINDLRIPRFGNFSYCQLSPGQSFVAMSFITDYVMNGAGGFSAFHYEVKIISWDTDYQLSVIGMPDIDNIESGRFTNIPLSLLSSGGTGIGPVAIQNMAIGTGPNYLRFDGVNWTCESVGIAYEGFTDLTHQYYWYAYDPQGVIATENTDSGCISRVGVIDPSNPNTGWQTQILVDNPNHDPERYWKDYPSQSISGITIGDQVYGKPLSSQWGALSDLLLIDLATVLSSDEFIDTTTIINGSNYLAFLILDADQSPKDTGIVYLKNGCIEVNAEGDIILDRLIGQKVFQAFATDHRYRGNVNGKLSATISGVVTYPVAAGSLDDTPSITLSRYAAEAFKGLISGHVVKSVTQGDGYNEIAKCYKYDEVSAAADGLRGTLLKFYRVTEYQGCSIPQSQQDGYTVSIFYNGLPKDPLTETPIEAYSILDGQLQQKKIYDIDNTVKASTETSWNIQEEIATHSDDTNTRKIYGAIPQVVTVISRQDGIETSVNTTYSLVSGNPVKIESSYHDSRGQQILTRTELKYAYQVYEGLWQQQMLTLTAQKSQFVTEAMMASPWELVSSEVQTYKLWQLDESLLDQWGTWDTYIANSDNPDTFIWWDGTPEPLPSQGWQRTSRAISRNKEGGLITAEDMEGLYTTILYDNTQTFALATFNNAQPEDGILYTSFEDYQDSPWSLLSGSGDITNLDSFTGSSCYELIIPVRGANASILACTVTVANPNQWYCFNLWYKTPNIQTNSITLEISAMGEGSPLTARLPKATGQWQPYQWSVDLSNLGVTGPVELTLKIKADPLRQGDESYLRLDDIVFAPRLSPFSATSYDLKKLRAVGGVSANGVSAKMLYNMWDAAYTNIGSNNQTSALASSYSIRQDPDYDPLTPSLFSSTGPNRDIVASGRDKGFYDRLQSRESLENYVATEGSLTNWQVSNKRLVLESGTGLQLLKLDTSGIINNNWSALSVYAEVLPGTAWQTSQTNPSQIMFLGVLGTNTSPLRLLVQWNGRTSAYWELLKWSNGTYINIESNIGIPWQPSWHLTIIDDRLLFTANGILIFNYQDTDLTDSPLTVQFGGQDPSTLMVLLRFST